MHISACIYSEILQAIRAIDHHKYTVDSISTYVFLFSVVLTLTFLHVSDVLVNWVPSPFTEKKRKENIAVHLYLHLGIDTAYISCEFEKESGGHCYVLLIIFLCLFSGFQEIVKALGPDACYTRTGMLLVVY